MNKVTTHNKPVSTKSTERNINKDHEIHFIYKLKKTDCNITNDKPMKFKATAQVQTVQSVHSCAICKEISIAASDLIKHKCNHVDEIIAVFSSYLSLPNSIKCNICSTIIKTLPLVILEMEEAIEKNHGLCQFDRLVKCFEDHKYENVNCNLFCKIFDVSKVKRKVCNSSSSGIELGRHKLTRKFGVLHKLSSEEIKIVKNSREQLNKDLVLADHNYDLKVTSNSRRMHNWNKSMQNNPLFKKLTNIEPQNVINLPTCKQLTRNVSKLKIYSTKLPSSKKQIAINNKTVSNFNTAKGNKLYKQFGDATSTDSCNLYSTIFRGNYDCYVCGKKCSNKNDLEIHKVVHINDYRIHVPEMNHVTISPRASEQKKDHSKKMEKLRNKFDPKKIKVKKLQILNKSGEMDSSVIVDLISKCHISNDTVKKVIDASKSTNRIVKAVRTKDSELLKVSNGTKRNATIVYPTQRTEERICIVTDEEDNDDCILLENDNFNSTNLNDGGEHITKNRNLGDLIPNLIGNITDNSTEYNESGSDKEGAPITHKTNETTIKGYKDRFESVLCKTPDDAIGTKTNSRFQEEKSKLDNTVCQRPLSGKFGDDQLLSKHPEELDKSTSTSKSPPLSVLIVDDLIPNLSDNSNSDPLSISLGACSDEEEINVENVQGNPVGKSTIAQINISAETLNSSKVITSVKTVWNDDFQSDDDMSIEQELIKEINDIMEIDLNDDNISVLSDKETEHLKNEVNFNETSNLSKYVRSNLIDLKKEFESKRIKAETDLHISETTVQGNSPKHDSSDYERDRIFEDVSKDLDNKTKNLLTNKERKRKGKKEDVSCAKNRKFHKIQCAPETKLSSANLVKLERLQEYDAIRSELHSVIDIVELIKNENLSTDPQAQKFNANSAATKSLLSYLLLSSPGVPESSIIQQGTEADQFSSTATKLDHKHNNNENSNQSTANVEMPLSNNVSLVFQQDLDATNANINFKASQHGKSKGSDTSQNNSVLIKNGILGTLLMQPTKTDQLNCNLNKFEDIQNDRKNRIELSPSVDDATRVNLVTEQDSSKLEKQVRKKRRRKSRKLLFTHYKSNPIPHPTCGRVAVEKNKPEEKISVNDKPEKPVGRESVEKTEILENVGSITFKNNKIVAKVPVKKQRLPGGRMLRFKGIQLNCLKCSKDSEIMDLMYCFSCNEQFYTMNAFNYHIKTSLIHNHSFKCDIVSLFKWDNEKVAQTAGDCNLREEDVFSLIKELLHLNTFDDLHRLDMEYQSASNSVLESLSDLAEKWLISINTNCDCDIRFIVKTHRVLSGKDKIEWYKKKAFFFQKSNDIELFDNLQDRPSNPNIKQSNHSNIENNILPKSDNLISIDQQVVPGISTQDKVNKIETQFGSCDLKPKRINDNGLMDIIKWEYYANGVDNKSSIINATSDQKCGNVSIEQLDNLTLEGTCRICLKITANTEILRHIQYHIENRTYKCYICHKAFMYMSSLFKHNSLTDHKSYFKCYESSCAPKSDFLEIGCEFHYHKKKIQVQKHSCYRKIIENYKETPNTE